MSKAKKIKNYLLAKGMEAVIPALSKHKPEILISMMDKISKAGIEKMKKNHTGTEEDWERRVEAARGFFNMAKRSFPTLSKETQKKLAFNLFFNTISVGDEKREAYNSKYGEYPPFFLLISPSMACDLRCQGCYAWKYPKEQSLSKEKVVEILREARDEMGIYFIAVTGGEPTYWPHLEEIAKEFDDMFFMVYTHGQRIDEAMAERFARLGNIYPAISIEGDAKLTDARRGEGAHDRIMQTMANLKKHGVLFGYSLTHTSKNHDYSCSEEFLNHMIAQGAAFGWVFQYIPIGREPNLELVPSAEQRVERRKLIHQARKNKPLLVFDFWNDGDAVDGCIAWGRKYLHVTARGYVEPCVFVHFAKDSVHEKTLGECLRSEVFKEMRSKQPFHEDRRRPCPQIDHPHILLDLVKRHEMFPTHEGAEDIIGPHFDFLCTTANAFAEEIAKSDNEKQPISIHSCSSCDSCK